MSKQKMDKKKKKKLLKIWMIIIIPLFLLAGIITTILLFSLVFTPSRELKKEIDAAGQGIYIKDTGNPDDNETSFEKWINPKIERILGIDGYSIQNGIDYDIDADFTPSTYSDPGETKTYLYEKQMTITPKGSKFKGKPVEFWYIVDDSLSFSGFRADPSVPEENQADAPRNYIHDVGSFDNKISIQDINSDADLTNYILDNFTKNIIGFDPSDVTDATFTYKGNTRIDTPPTVPIDWSDKSSIIVDAQSEYGIGWYYMELDNLNSPSWTNSGEFPYGTTYQVWFTN